MTRDKWIKFVEIAASVSIDIVNLLLSMFLILTVVEVWVRLIPWLTTGLTGFTRSIMVLAILPIVFKMMRSSWATLPKTWQQPEAARRWSEMNNKEYLTSVTVYPSRLQRIVGCPIVVTFDDDTKRDA